MVAHVGTVAFLGLEARAVDVQVQVAGGQPTFVVVGLPDKAVRESRERVQATLDAIGLALPPKRIIVNLSPADLPKEGSHYDLAIALGLLAAMGVVDAEMLSGFLVVGELGLDGRLAPVPGVLLAALFAAGADLGLICPASQGGEAAWAGEVEVVAAPDLLSLINHLKGSQLLSPPVRSVAEITRGGPDLGEVKGQETAKRALEIAAAGGHNLLMSGPPGSGKSLLAAALPGILPDLTPAEALEVSMVASMAGELEGGRLRRSRPYRSPHHSASMPALVGGGTRARPGEVSLAHLGVLFLDELPEFQRSVLDSLRQPLETGHITVSRAALHVTYPARVQLIAAMNPCRCGHLADAGLACARAPKCAADYQGRISGPLIDSMGYLSSVKMVCAFAQVRLSRPLGAILIPHFPGTTARPRHNSRDSLSHVQPRYRSAAAGRGSTVCWRLSVNQSEHITTLVSDLLDDIELSRLDAERLLLKCSRLARLTGSDEVRKWIGYEMAGYNSTEAMSLRYMGLTGRWINFEKKTGYWGPLAQQEANIESQKAQLAASKLDSVSGEWASVTSRELTEKRQQIVNSISALGGVRSRVLSLLHSFVSTVYYERLFSGTAETVFEKYKQGVDAIIIEKSGLVFEKMPSIVERLQARDPEAVSQALVTCRRVIESFADAMYPATDQTIELEGNEIKLDASRHLNRLNAYIASQTNSNSRRTRFRQNLSNLYNRVCAAVHNEITSDEAFALFLNTYLFLGEVLTLAIETQNDE